MGVDRRGNDTVSAMTHNPQLQYNCQLKKQVFNSVTCLISQLLLKIPVFYRNNYQLFTNGQYSDSLSQVLLRHKKTGKACSNVSSG